MSVRPHVANHAESARDAVEAACSSLDEAVMVRIKTCRLTRNPQLGDPVAWLNLTFADGRELDHVALHRSPMDRCCIGRARVVPLNVSCGSLLGHSASHSERLFLPLSRH